MKCVICKHGSTVEGLTTVTLERDGSTVVFKEVPAQVCGNCGEAYVSDKVATELMNEAARIIRSGAEVDVRHFRLDAA